MKCQPWQLYMADYDFKDWANLQKCGNFGLQQECKGVKFKVSYFFSKCRNMCRTTC